MRLEKLVIIMSAKKVVLIIVEGPTDEDALGVLFERFFDKETVRVKVVHGDITTKKQVNSSNILNRITEIVKQSLKEYKLRKTDLQRVVHLVDTDGVFVPESAVVYDEQSAKPFYTLTEIKTAHRDGILLRNNQKKANLEKLHTTKHIWKDIPYSVFYLSSNLDHALYNKHNLSDEEKEQYALQFVNRYKDDMPSFIQFICNSDFSVIDGYLPSWIYIKNNLRSLERHTNLGLCFLREDPE